MAHPHPLSTRTTLAWFAGGQDSSTCFAGALSRYGSVETVVFDDRQRPVIELEQRHTLREAIVEQFPIWAPHLARSVSLREQHYARRSCTDNRPPCLRSPRS